MNHPVHETEEFLIFKRIQGFKVLLSQEQNYPDIICCYKWSLSWNVIAVRFLNYFMKALGSKVVSCQWCQIVNFFSQHLNSQITSETISCFKNHENAILMSVHAHIVSWKNLVHKMCHLWCSWDLAKMWNLRKFFVPIAGEHSVRFWF